MIRLHYEQQRLDSSQIDGTSKEQALKTDRSSEKVTYGTNKSALTMDEMVGTAPSFLLAGQVTTKLLVPWMMDVLAEHQALPRLLHAPLDSIPEPSTDE